MDFHNSFSIWSMCCSLQVVIADRSRCFHRLLSCWNEVRFAGLPGKKKDPAFHAWVLMLFLNITSSIMTQQSSWLNAQRCLHDLTQGTQQCENHTAVLCHCESLTTSNKAWCPSFIEIPNSFHWILFLIRLMFQSLQTDVEGIATTGSTGDMHTT